MAADRLADRRLYLCTPDRPDLESFRRIAAAWNRYQDEVRRLPSEAAQLERVAQMRQELAQLGALPADLPPDPELLWSLLVFEAENGLG